MVGYIDHSLGRFKTQDMCRPPPTNRRSVCQKSEHWNSTTSHHLWGVAKVSKTRRASVKVFAVRQLVLRGVSRYTMDRLGIEDSSCLVVIP